MKNIEIWQEARKLKLGSKFLENLDTLLSSLEEKNIQIPSNKVIMKFKDAPVGARFKFIGDDVPKDICVKINAYPAERGLIATWNGNVEGHQSFCCWVDEENGYDFDTEIELI